MSENLLNGSYEGWKAAADAANCDRERRWIQSMVVWECGNEVPKIQFKTLS